MVNFIFVDLVLLAIFALFISHFLYTRKHNLQRDGLLILYKAKWGIKLIDYVGEKYPRTLKVLSYVSIFTGYILMIGIVWLLGRIIWIYATVPEVVKAVKIPPILPLVPYLPQVFKISFLPPFYFTYWILILAIVAIPHEFAHGIFAVFNKVKVKTTGFGFFPFFLPVFLAAFVELDEKEMAKKKKIPQMAVLSSGTFANVLTAILFLIVLWGFFSLAFVPSGVVFDSYSYSLVPATTITAINGFAINESNFNYDEIFDLTRNGTNNVTVNGQNYIISKDFLDLQNSSLRSSGVIALFNNAPAINVGLNGSIVAINNASISNVEDLSSELSKYQPGDEVEIETRMDEGEQFYHIKLGENPENGKAWLGIGFNSQNNNGIMAKVVNFFTSFRKPHVNYEPRWEISLFIYNLLWWLVLICITVALMNMLPVGIFDGGRFFYLTVLGLTGNEKIARRSFKFMTYLFLFSLLVLMFFWIISF